MGHGDARDIREFWRLPEQVDKRAMNDGWGCCNQGTARRSVCVFGGIGCNVDHPTVKILNALDIDRRLDALEARVGRP